MQIESFAEFHSGNRVMLGPAAFADSDQLVLTRMPRRGPDGAPLDGRAALPQPLVLKLQAGPQGCRVHVAGGAATASPGGAGGTGGEPTGAAQAAQAAPLPACTCIPL
jgi:hypothetical protein